MPKFLALVALFVSGALILNGCSSSGEFEIPEINPTHGAHADDGATYGTGPNNTKPYPQSEEVNLNGVPGATPKYEPLSRGGNKNYAVLGNSYQVWRDCNSYLEIGTASWYGPGFHGNKTSNGEVYNQKGYSAAHKNLPLPSYLKVTNLENGKAVIVRVNDRGPFHGSRIIDLSEGAAKAIDMTKKGTAKVKLEYIDVRQGNVIANLAHTVVSGTGSSNKDSLKELIESLKTGKETSTATKIGAAVAAVQIASSIGDALEKASNESQSKSFASSTTSSSSSSITSSSSAKSSNSSYEVSYANLENELLKGESPSRTTADPSATAYVQIFTSSSQERASKVQNDLKNNASYAVSVVAEGSLYRVRIGPVPEYDLNRVVTQMKTLGYQDAFVKR